MRPEERAPQPTRQSFLRTASCKAMPAHLTPILGGKHPMITAATAGLRAKLGREPTEEEVLEEALRSEIAAMYQRWAVTGSPIDTSPRAR